MMIVGQAIYQTIVALTLHFAGHRIFNFNSTDAGTKIDQDNELNTLVFNTFVFCQICASSFADSRDRAKLTSRPPQSTSSSALDLESALLDQL